MTTIDKLNRLAELQAKREVIRLDKEAAIAKTLEPVKAQLDLIEAEYNVSYLDADLTALEADIRAEVLAAGSTAKGSSLICTWNKGRVSWDTKGLDGYAVAHPELNAFRKEGEPSTTIKAVRA